MKKSALCVSTAQCGFLFGGYDFKVICNRTNWSTHFCIGGLCATASASNTSNRATMEVHWAARHHELSARFQWQLCCRFCRGESHRSRFEGKGSLANDFRSDKQHRGPLTAMRLDCNHVDNERRHHTIGPTGNDREGP